MANGLDTRILGLSTAQPVSTAYAHENIDNLISQLGDAGTIRAADPLWNKYAQMRESLGDWMVEMFPPSHGVQPGTPRYERAQENIRNLFGMLPQEKWELPLYAIGGAGSLRKVAHKYSPNLHKTAKKIFGTTDDAREAGYIVEDGSMLDFSGKIEGGTAGRRAYDHREINRVGDGMEGGKRVFKNVGMTEFIGSGAIRWGPESLLFQFGKMPTQAQFSRMKKIHAEKNRILVPGTINKIRINAEKGPASMPRTDFYREYELDIPWKNIERDILQFYRTGKKPSITQQFHR